MSGNQSVDIWIAGAFAAFTVDLVVYPLDTIKTRVQSRDYTRLYAGTGGHAFNRAMFRGLYQGVASVIIATLPASGAFFTTYEGAKHLLESNTSQALPQALIHAMASGTAELVSCSILTPAEVIKQNSQMIDNSKSGPPRVNATLATLQKFRGNPLALWRGYTALAGRNLPFTALQFPLFENIRSRIRRHRDESGTRTNTLLENGLITAVSAGAGGSVAALVTTPIDVVKTRVMLDAAEGATMDRASPHIKTNANSNGNSVAALKRALQKAPGKHSSHPTRKTSMQVGREIFNQDGLRGLFRGGLLRSVWTLVGAGLYLGVYETGRVYLAQRRGIDAIPEDFQ